MRSSTSKFERVPAIAPVRTADPVADVVSAIIKVDEELIEYEGNFNKYTGKIKLKRLSREDIGKAIQYVQDKGDVFLRSVKTEVGHVVEEFKKLPSYQIFIEKINNSHVYMAPPDFTVVNDDIYSGDPVYFVNGILNTKEDAIESANKLSHHLKRQVYLIYNPSRYSDDASLPIAILEDLTESLKDMAWPLEFVVPNAIPPATNPATAQVAYLFHHAANNNIPISIVSHSQGCIIVRNACAIMQTLKKEEFIYNKLAWVATGSPLNDISSHPRPPASRYRSMTNSNDPVAGIIGARGNIDFSQSLIKQHSFERYYDQIRSEDLWQIRLENTTANIVTLGRNQHGGQEIFYIKNDGIVYHRFQAFPNASHWEGEFTFATSTGGTVSARQIAVGRNQDGRQELFYLDHESSIYHFVQRYENAPIWDGPFDFYKDHTGREITQIAVARNENGREVLFYIKEGLVSYYVQDDVNSSGWTYKRTFQDFRATQIAIGCNHKGSLELFFIQAGEIKHLFQNRPNTDNWSPVFPFYGVGDLNNPVTQIALGRNQNGGQELFYARNAKIYHYFQNLNKTPDGSVWDNAEDFYEAQAIRIAVGQNANETQELFYITLESEIRHRFQPTPNASNWSPDFGFYLTHTIGITSALTPAQGYKPIYTSFFKNPSLISHHAEDNLPALDQREGTARKRKLSVFEGQLSESKKTSEKSKILKP